ncbi:kinase-regulated stress-responsive transcription factor skn7 [Agyrium rufum]|nr:kinase-regulated stress-responsive transcription factor skn7 [Agyrium rufum]
MDGGQMGAVGAANNSSDFVKKLYKMLEDPSYSSVVRWGDEGDSFVVLENERFTKSILPKHFKHSNFASFVRQLNKYDFHKVRQNNEENGQSPYGAGAWEFRHPEFKANNREALDNIRRKAPAPRKPTQILDESIPTHQMDLVNTQLIATQQQLQQLQDRYNELSMHHSMLLQELIGVQKTVVNHEHVMQNVMNYLHSVDARQRRDSKLGAPFGDAALNVPTTATEQQPNLPQMDDEPASPLANASKLLNDLNADVQLNYKNLEHMNELHSKTMLISTPPPNGATDPVTARQPTSAASSTSLAYAKLNGDVENLVYPVGHNNGIDPTYSEHIHNIPYPMPSKEQLEARSGFSDARKKSTAVDPGWARRPQILLVEDDPTCRKIGSKFLYSLQCAIDSAFDGLEAVNKMNAGSKYDLVLMDIIMPNLDGISASHLIRQFDNTPIIAMTSNIRSDDISMYFQHGMNDVLPKPFTKEGLLNMLDKFLGHLKLRPEGLDMVPNSASTMTHSSTGKSINDDSPAQSPSTVTTWHSPGNFSGISPTLANPAGRFMQQQGMAPQPPTSGYSMDPSNMHQFQTPQQPPQAINLPQPPPPPRPVQQHRRQISEVISPGDDVTNDAKRARTFAQTNPAMGHIQRR